MKTSYGKCGKNYRKTLKTIIFMGYEVNNGMFFCFFVWLLLLARLINRQVEVFRGFGRRNP